MKQAGSLRFPSAPDLVQQKVKDYDGRSYSLHTIGTRHICSILFCSMSHRTDIVCMEIL